jgi:hypothetical protein
MSRLEKLSDRKVLAVAKLVIEDFPHDQLRSAIEQLDKDGHIVSDITRHHLAEALDEFSLSGKRDLVDLLRKHWPEIDRIPSVYEPFETLMDDIRRHVLRNDDWSNSDLLKQVGFLTCSQAQLFEFLEDVVHPVRRDTDEQERIVAKLNPILRRDGYFLAASRRVSGYQPTGSRRQLRPGSSRPTNSSRKFSGLSTKAAYTQLGRRRLSGGSPIQRAPSLPRRLCLRPSAST